MEIYKSACQKAGIPFSILICDKCKKIIVLKYSSKKDTMKIIR